MVSQPLDEKEPLLDTMPGVHLRKCRYVETIPTFTFDSIKKQMNKPCSRITWHNASFCPLHSMLIENVLVQPEVTEGTTQGVFSGVYAIAKDTKIGTIKHYKYAEAFNDPLDKVAYIRNQNDTLYNLADIRSSPFRYLVNFGTNVPKTKKKGKANCKLVQDPSTLSLDVISLVNIDPLTQLVL